MHIPNPLRNISLIYGSSIKNIGRKEIHDREDTLWLLGCSNGLKGEETSIFKRQ